MVSKIVTFAITFLINVAIGVVVLFFMLIAMNGFSESDANYGLGAYIVLAFLVSLAMGTLAAITVHLLMRRQFGGVVAGLIAVAIFSVIGGVLKFVCSMIGVMVAEYVRVNH